MNIGRTAERGTDDRQQQGRICLHRFRRIRDAANFSGGNELRYGVVLIVVLVLAIMVALAGFGFLSAMSTEYEAARLNGSMRQAKQTLASAESTLLWFGSLSKQQRKLVGGLYHNPLRFRGHLVESLAEPGAGSSSASLTSNPLLEQPASEDRGLVDDRWRFSVVAVDQTPEQNSVLRFGLKNESSKLNLNTLMKWEQATPGAGRASLMQLAGMTEAAADAILDWMDADDQAREFGAETDYYQTLDQPYRAANAVPNRLTELLFVKGVTRAMLMGTGAVGDSSEPLLESESSLSLVPSIGGNGDLSSSSEVVGGIGWQQHLTLYSAERNLNGQGQPRIFLNSTDPVQLERQLAAVLPEEMVRYILLARVYGLTVSSERQSGVAPSAAPWASSMVAAFPIASLADLVDSTVQVSTANGVIVVQSPLLTSSPDFAPLAASLFDLTTVTAESIIFGRIHLPTASETVLRTIPGLTPELVTQIITQRATLDPAEVESMTWLLSRNVLNPAVFRRVLPELTTGGDVFQADVIVHRAIGGPMLRRNLILDAASTPARRLYWSELTDYPWPYSPELLLPRAP